MIHDIRPTVVCAILLCALIQTGVVCDAGETLSDSDQYVADLKGVEYAISSQTLANVKAIADRANSEWRSRNGALYGKLMLRIVEALRSEDFRDTQQMEYAQKYSVESLQRADEFSPETEISLVMHSQTDLVILATFDPERIHKDRTKQLELWFHAWKRLKGAIDPSWSADLTKIAPKDSFTGNVLPPAEITSGGSGMSPDSIKDPQLRAKYEQAIKRNDENAARWSRQYDLDSLQKQFVPTAEAYIIALCRLKPVDVPEIETMVKRFGLSEEGKKILEQVQIEP